MHTNQTMEVKKSLSNRFGIIWRLVYLGIIISCLWSTLQVWGYDDPYITYRYARNLASGVGFVYNTGERVLSTTTPLFTFLLAATAPLWRLGLDLPQIANFIGALSLGVGGLLIFSLSGYQSSLIGSVGSWTALFLYPFFPLLVSTLGSETPLYLALCLGACVAYSRQRNLLAVILAGLATLTRPDGILVAVVLLADSFFRTSWQNHSLGTDIVRKLKASLRRLLLPALLFMAVVAPWILFAWLYFGSPVPATLFTKQQQGTMAISQQFGPGLFYMLRGYARHVFAWVEAALCLLGVLTLIRKKQSSRLTQGLAALLGWTTLYLLAYTCLGVSRYHWYYAPLVPAVIVLVGLGVNALFHKVKYIQWKPVRFHEILQFTLLVGIVFGVALLILAQMATAGLLPGNRRQSDPRLLVYREAGEWLRMNAMRKDAMRKDAMRKDAMRKNAMRKDEPVSAAALEIGIIGYYASRTPVPLSNHNSEILAENGTALPDIRMIDFAGLLQPDVANQLSSASTYADVADWVVEHYQPDFLALNRGVFSNLENGYVAQYCQLMKMIPEQPAQTGVMIDIYDCTH